MHECSTTILRNYARKTESLKLSAENIKSALADLKHRKISHRRTGRLYYELESTLHEHFKVKLYNLKIRIWGVLSQFSEMILNQLVEHALQLHKMFFGLHIKTLRALAEADSRIF